MSEIVAKPLITRKILGDSPATKEMIRLIERVATSKTNVLIIGESGTGKELVARMIHEAGAMRGHPFIPVNCGAIPENLIESEMFGHKRGSFTGAVSDKMGLFEAANQGTLFLDEVGELPLGMQVKLLRAIQERSFKKVGGTDDVKVDVRIIAATNRNLEDGVKKGTFREDLYYRLNVILIRTPPLRERRTDVRLLANAFLEKIAKKFNKPLQGFTEEVYAIFDRHTWPGNVRELENVVERLVTLESDEWIGPEHLPTQILETVKNLGMVEAASGGSPAVTQSQSGFQSSNVRSSPPGGTPASMNFPGNSGGATLNLPAPEFSRGPLNLDEILNEVEKRYLLAALEFNNGVKKKAAESLGITFRSIRYRLKKLGLDGGGGADEGEE